MGMDSRALQLTDELTEAARLAAPYGVSSNLSEHDQLLGYLTKFCQITPTAAINLYFTGGAEDARRVAALLDQFGMLGGHRKVLEFAAGYGRVARHLKQLLCENRYIASEIHPAACALINTQIGVPALLSSLDPADLVLPGEQDFVFALSFFSHLPLATQGRWLNRLYSLLAPEGYLMFTTHGDHALRAIPDFFRINFDPETGFGYRHESDQPDLSSDDYGSAVMTTGFAVALINEFTPDAEIVSFRTKAWFDLQDEWIIRKPPEQT
jgi:SAM-dependent methyltransferase